MQKRRGLPHLFRKTGKFFDEFFHTRINPVRIKFCAVFLLSPLFF
jgi:hypothetical protein